MVASPPSPGLLRMPMHGHDCLRLRTQQAQALISLHGAQLLSWVPACGQERLWLSPQALPEPAPIRGGIPLCWPWFGRQGMPHDGMQHGPVRTLPWEPLPNPDISENRVSVGLVPCRTESTCALLERWAPGLALRLTVTLDNALALQLTTINEGKKPFVLSQALHSYLRVADVQRCRIEELAGLPYADKLTGAQEQRHDQPWMLDVACDRIYQHDRVTGFTCTINDSVAKRRLVLQSEGSGSVVVWNPGPHGASALPDMPDEGWTQFLCVETANAGDDTVVLVPGASHHLRLCLLANP